MSRRLRHMMAGATAYASFLAVAGLLELFLLNRGTVAIDGQPVSLLQALAIDLGLLALFGVQHSVMARDRFKRAWTRMVPEQLERTCYVLAANACLLAVVMLWQPIPAALWQLEHPAIRNLVWAVHVLGWAVLIVATFLMDHYELFGLRQTFCHGSGAAPQPPVFRTPGLYRWVRHPMMSGVILLCWATPDLGGGHALFAAAMTVYVLIGVHFEERALVQTFGESYRDYQRRVPSLLPLRPPR